MSFSEHQPRLEIRAAPIFKKLYFQVLATGASIWIGAPLIGWLTGHLIGGVALAVAAIPTTIAVVFVTTRRCRCPICSVVL